LSALRQGQTVKIRVLASDVMLSLGHPSQISALNVLSGTVSEIGERSGPGGSTVHLLVACGEAKLAVRLTAKSVAALGLAPGKPVHAVIKSVSVETP